MFSYFLIGLLVGAGTGVPIGAVGVAVIDATYRHPFRRAVGVGLGGATGDLLYSALGVLGLGALLLRHPGLPPILHTISGVALIAYGAFQIRSRPRLPVADGPVDDDRSLRDRKQTRTGFALGLGLIIANPASAVTWVVIVGGLMGHATRLEGISAVIGIGVGSATWFLILAHLARRGTYALGDRAVWISRIAGVLLLGYGLFSLGRGVRYWIS